MDAVRSRVNTAKEVGEQYGLVSRRALQHDTATYLAFPHPQNLLAGWAGAASSLALADLWDTFAAGWAARNSGKPSVAGAMAGASM